MLPPRYRGFLEVDAAICTGCQACERACPIACIQINLEKDPVNPKQRVVTQFDIDEAKCMFCGLCVEPCPTGAIQHTREFEGSMSDLRNLTIRWADPLAPFPVYKVDKAAEYFPRAPLGSLVRAEVRGPRLGRPGAGLPAAAHARGAGRPGRRRGRRGRQGGGCQGRGQAGGAEAGRCRCACRCAAARRRCAAAAPAAAPARPRCRPAAAPASPATPKSEGTP